MSGGRIAVLRLGHRKGRDPRITTHLGLVARAFGADEFYLAGDEDAEMFATLAAVGERFGSPLKLEHVKSPMGFLKRWIRDSGSGVEGLATHLTMYGERFRDAIPQMPRNRDLLVVVGGSKVPAEVFEHCQFNIAIGNQPHSEVAALALFLDEWGGNLDMAEKFKEGRLEIIPSKQGKVVIDHDEES